MFRNYLTMARRTLVKNWLYTAINVAGLSVSMACCWLISLYVWHELTFDQYHERADAIFRIITRFKTPGSDDGLARTNTTVGPQLRQTYPEIVDVARFKSLPVTTVRRGSELTNEGDIYEADRGVFKVFSFPFLTGNATALDRPNSVVLTEQLAEKYVGTTDAVGKTLTINRQLYTVTGVLAALPTNTDLKFSALLTWQDTPPTAEEIFDTSCFTFVQLSDPAQADQLRRQLARFDQTQLTPRIKAMGYDLRLEHQLQALTELHFIDGLFDDTPKGNRTYTAVFAIVAAFILLVACINYINLYVAQSTKRQKEVGVRKVLGAGKRQLAGQFLSEAFLIVLLSALVSVLVIVAIRPVAGQLTAIPFTFPDWSFVAGSVGVVGLVGLLTGLYPALFLSSTQPVRALKGTI